MLTVLRHQFGCTDPGRHVQIVPAHMSDRHSLARIAFGLHCTRKGKTGLFLDRERIEFSAQHDNRPWPVLQDGHHTGPAHTGAHVVSQGLDALSQHPGGALLMKSKLRIAMQVDVKALDLRIDHIHRVRCACGRADAAASSRSHKGEPRCTCHYKPGAIHGFCTSRIDTRCVELSMKPPTRIWCRSPSRHVPLYRTPERVLPAPCWFFLRYP